MADTNPTCTFPGCGRPRYGKGLCNTHYQQQRNSGTLRPIRHHKAPPAEVFASSFDVGDDGCWRWNGPLSANGYGQVADGRGGRILAHRFSFTHYGGNLTDADILDHRCRVKICVNPAHLQIATRKTNGENTDLSKANTSGVRGVYWDPANQKWCGNVKHNGKKYWVGRFSDLADAEAAVVAKRNELFTNNLADRT